LAHAGEHRRRLRILPGQAYAAAIPYKNNVVATVGSSTRPRGDLTKRRIAVPVEHDIPVTASCAGRD